MLERGPRNKMFILISIMKYRQIIEKLYDYKTYFETNLPILYVQSILVHIKVTDGQNSDTISDL
jgi:hypothetical protein